jgi:hypothetical protein
VVWGHWGLWSQVLSKTVRISVCFSLAVFRGSAKAQVHNWPSTRLSQGCGCTQWTSPKKRTCMFRVCIENDYYENLATQAKQGRKWCGGVNERGGGVPWGEQNYRVKTFGKESPERGNGNQTAGCLQSWVFPTTHQYFSIASAICFPPSTNKRNLSKEIQTVWVELCPQQKICWSFNLQYLQMLPWKQGFACTVM